MLAEIKQIPNQWMMEIKTVFLLGLANFSQWYVLNASEMIATFTQLLSLATLIALFFYHILNTTKIKLETKKIELDIELQENQLNKLSQGNIMAKHDPGEPRKTKIIQPKKQTENPKPKPRSSHNTGHKK